MDSSAKLEADKVDPKASLRHLLASEDNQYPEPNNSGSHAPWPTNNSSATIAKTAAEHQEDMESNAQGTAMTTTTRRNASGSVSSVYSGNRIRFLKKDDGQPLWRKDIQYLFLRIVFEDENKVFTKASDGTTGHTFADIYIDAMAKSSKCSQILKDKLLQDRASALQMAMICLLVNVGRMNTTLNFFPEMRARVRTYHSIPCLQAQQGAQAYKQLQDGPRLKSILKGATEDVQQPGTIDDIMRHPKPRTNPVNLIFVLSQYAPRISENHFFSPRDFFDLFMRSTISSQSRARAFLWLIWWYLESDFSAEDTQRNPFGPGISGDDSKIPTKVPTLEVLSEEQADLENLDTEEELAYGEAKRIEREAIVANDMPPTAHAPKRGQKTAIMEHQHNYRFRHSPFGSSASDSGGSRGRPSVSPPPGLQPTDHHRRQRHQRSDGDLTRSPSPQHQATPKRRTAGPSAHHGAQTNSIMNDDMSIDNSPNSKKSPNTTRKIGPRTKAARKYSEKALSDHLATHENPKDNVSQRKSSNAPNHHSTGSLRRMLPNSYDPSGPRYSGDDLGHTNISFNESGRSNHKKVMTSPDPPMSGGKRSRLAPTAEQSRREKVRDLLYEQMREIRKTRSKERRRMGVIADAWHNCNNLPDDWDSDEDGRFYLGGLDRLEHGFPRDSLPNIRDDDVGDSSRRLTNSLREVSRALEGVVIKLPKEEHMRDDDFCQTPSALSERLVPYNVQHYTEYTDKLDKNMNNLLFEPHSRINRPSIQSDDEVQPASKRKRPSKPKTSKKAQSSSASKSRNIAAPTQGSRKSARSGQRTSKSLDNLSVRRGQQGVPADEFFSGMPEEVDAELTEADLDDVLPKNSLKINFA